MKKLYFIIMGLSFLVLVNNQMAKAQGAPEETKSTTDVLKSQDVGNKICPVTGEKIDEKAKATYEYEGRIFNFCCAMCIDEFKKEPQKYIKKVEEELQSEAKSMDASKDLQE